MIGCFKRWQNDRRGIAAMEFLLIAPFLFMLLFAILEAGGIINEYMTLTNATTAGATQLAFSVETDATPYTDTVNTIKNAAPGLSPLTIVTSINGTACASDSACSSALNSSGAQYVTVGITYSCAAMNIVFNLFPSCTLSTQQTERVQ